MLTVDTPIVLLSPHCDDIVLSVGGWLAKLKRLAPQMLDHMTVCTVFSWSKSSPRRPAYDGNSARVTELRSMEEHDYCERAGVALELLDLPDTSFLNIGYRDPLVLETDQRYVHLRQFLQDKLQNRIVIAPLSLGEHIDHRIVHECAKHHEAATVLTLYYEDLPYASWYDDTERQAYITKNLGEAASPLHIALEQADKKEKIDNLQCYPSQMNAREREEVSHYQAWGNELGETLWLARDQRLDPSLLAALLING